ncbi:Deoxyadenosine kinase @ Deoxyguanosine kinase [hydrothermal vent metagenome]|uniref:Deoxyadenosine kinase @ Deoxyguanosine kinase n=1 Tax=hydrothermal vent metagenome TaxID=652676 RepID=A0A3B0Y910_9ZZZZ
MGLENSKIDNRIHNKKYIVVEGPIGVGKTSLARRLACSFGSELILEDSASNPFLEQFYNTQGQGALPVQLFFLFQRAQQLLAMRQDDLFTPVVVSDFLLAKDRLFACMTLDKDELNLYDQILSSLKIDPPTPDLVIYLQAPESVLRQRIHGRGIHYEQTINTAYLTDISEAYARFFHNYHDAPLLIVNASEIDPAHKAGDYGLLLQRILEVDSGRHYFNPAPIAV